MNKLIGFDKLLIEQAKSTEQSGSKKVNDNKDVKISAIMGRKIIIITINGISTSEK